jgi:hypothetical protein
MSATLDMNFTRVRETVICLGIKVDAKSPF